MKSATEIRNMTPTFLDLLEPKIEAAAKRGETFLDLFDDYQEYSYEDSICYTRTSLKGLKYSDLEVLKAKGFRVEVTARDYTYGGFLWRKKTIKREYYTIYW